MKTDIIEWITQNKITPLQWGDSLDVFCAVWPTARALFEELLQFGYPYLILDEVEFYFEGDDFARLCEVVVKAWTISKKTKSEYFNYGWLRKGLTCKQVKETLDKLDVPYHIERGPAFNTPNIRTSTGVLFAFYTDFEQEEKAELSKVYLKYH